MSEPYRPTTCTRVHVYTCTPRLSLTSGRMSERYAWTDDSARWNVFVAKKCPGYVENGWFTKKTKRDFFNLVRAKKKKKKKKYDDEEDKAGSRPFTTLVY